MAVVDGTEVAHIGPMPVNRLMADMKIPPHPLIAMGRVHAVGVPVAAVVADDPRAARDAADLVDVEYQPLAAVVEAEAALSAAAPTLYPDVAGNRSFRRAIRQGEAQKNFVFHAVGIEGANFDALSAIAVRKPLKLMTPGSPGGGNGHEHAGDGHAHDHSGHGH